MMKIKVAVTLAALAMVAGCNSSHPAPEHTATPTAAVMPFMTGPSPTCRPSNYANIPGTRTFGKKKCK